MFFNSEAESFLNNEKFESAYKLKLKSDRLLMTREEYLLESVKGRNILHIGFTDHLPLIDEKIREGKWLHAKLDESSQFCLGIDINSVSVKYIEDNYPEYDVCNLNIIDDPVPDIITENNWDYILLPDVLEHINTPVDFLRSIRTKYSKYCSKLIITAPNATNYGNIRNVFRNIERINTDHRFWYTPYTLAKVIADSGCKATSFDLVEYGTDWKNQFLKRFILQKYPLLRDTVVMEVELG